jgi:hypothetical protein
VVSVVIAYIAINLFFFKTPVPISGIAKAIGAPLFNNWQALKGFSGIFSKKLLVVFIVMEIIAFRANQRSFVFVMSIITFLLAALVQSLYYGAFSTWPIWPWYTYSVSFAMLAMAARVLFLSSRCFAANRIAVTFVVGCLFAVMAEDAVKGFGNGRPEKADDQVAHSWNQMSVLMLKDRIFSHDQNTIVAMADRAGGLAFWGRKKIFVVQTEGLLMGAEYIAARLKSDVPSYIDGQYHVQYYVVDREFTPTVTEDDGSKTYVVADPIQLAGARGYYIPTFCFPDSSLIYSRNYDLDAPSCHSQRLIFSYGARKECSLAALKVIQTAISTGGLHKLSLPSQSRRQCEP